MFVSVYTVPPDRVLRLEQQKPVIYTASGNFRSAVSYWIAYFCISSASTKLYPTLPDLQRAKTPGRRYIWLPDLRL